MHLSAILKILFNSWLTITNVAPRLSRSLRIVWSRFAAVIGSSPALGSSKRRIVAPRESALAMPALLIMPPESSPGVKLAEPGISMAFRSICAVRFLASRGSFENWSSGNRTFSNTVRDPNNAPLWYMIPKLRWISGISFPESIILFPRISMSPAMGGFKPMIVFIKVDFPHPEPPIMKTICFS